MASLIGLKMFTTHNADRKSLKTFYRTHFEGTTSQNVPKLPFLASLSTYVLREARKGNFRTFCEFVTSKCVLWNVFRDFLSALWVGNIFKPIREAIQTNSCVISTRKCEDTCHWKNVDSVSGIRPPKKILKCWPRTNIMIMNCFKWLPWLVWRCFQLIM